MRTIALGLALASMLTTSAAGALTWPTATARAEAELRSPDVVARRRGAAALAELGPARARPLVLAALSDADGEVRVLAARAAIRLGTADAVDSVAPWLGEREPRVKLAACDVLRRFPSPRHVPLLARALGDGDPDVRVAAAEALGASRAADASAPLAARLEDPSPSVREAVARALASIGDPRGVVPLLGKMQDSSPDVRRAVARALGRLRDPRAAQSLLLGVRDPSAAVRAESLRALGRLANPTTTDAIAPLASDRAPEVRRAACDALARIASPRAIELLVAALGATSDEIAAPLDATPARQALRTIGHATEAHLATALTRPRSAAQAAGAAWVLGALGAVAHEDAVTSGMRRAVLDAPAGLHSLAGLGTARSLPLVLEHLGDASAEARREARRAARRILDPAHPDGRAVEPIVFAMASAASADERAELVELLGRTGAPRAAGAVVPLFADPVAAVREAAIGAAAHLGPDNASVRRLLELLEERDGATRRLAAVALGRAGGPQVRDTLVARLTQRQEVDRHAVLLALGPVLARSPSRPAEVALVRALAMSAGGDRDAILSALGGTAAAIELATDAGDTLDEVDRRTLASALAATAHAAPLLQRWLAARDPAVRAEAAWALGSVAGADALAALARVAAEPELAPAINATASLGRVAARTGSREVTTRLCALATDPRPYVRSNARTALSAQRARCGDGSADRGAVLADPDPTARLAAARHVAAAPSQADEATLLQCADQDQSAAVAAACEARGQAAEVPQALSVGAEVYVASPSSATPEPSAPYALAYGDGTIRVGRTDRRGAVLEPRIPVEGAHLLGPALPGPPLRR